MCNIWQTHFAWARVAVTERGGDGAGGPGQGGPTALQLEINKVKSHAHASVWGELRGESEVETRRGWCRERGRRGRGEPHVRVCVGVCVWSCGHGAYTGTTGRRGLQLSGTLREGAAEDGVSARGGSPLHAAQGEGQDAAFACAQGGLVPDALPEAWLAANGLEALKGDGRAVHRKPASVMNRDHATYVKPVDISLSPMSTPPQANDMPWDL